MSGSLRAVAHARPGRARRADAPAPAAPSSGLLRLQRDGGNAAVARMLGTPVRRPAATGGDAAGVSTYRAGGVRRTVSVEIRRGPAADPSDAVTSRAPATVDHDAPTAAEPDGPSPDAVAAALAAQVVVPTEVPDGRTVTLPDLVVPADVGAPEQDAVAGAITYAPSVAQAGVVSPFGSTRWSTFTLSGISVTPDTGTYRIAFTLENPITYNVASGGCTDVPSATAPAITHANFAAVAADLTPDMADDGGRPPRTAFWAEDLTLRHERFHATERQGFGTAGAQAAQTWLSAQTASSIVDVALLVAQVPARVVASSQAAAGDVHTKESRAYGDGAALYQARADAIRARGATGAYPGAPAPGGTP